MTEPRRDFSADAAIWLLPVSPRQSIYFLAGWLIFAFGFFVASPFIDGGVFHPGVVVSFVSTTVIALVGVRHAHSSTRADRSGIAIKSPKPQSATWSEIEDARVVGRFSWSKKVQAQLLNGETWTLPHVPAKDLPAVLCWRSMDD